jgi:hypothetical protein
MAFAIITSINAAAATQTSSDDSGKKAIDICMERLDQRPRRAG